MHCQHRVELLLGHLVKQPVAQVAGIVDHGVNAPERIERRLHDFVRAVPGGDVVSARNGLSAERLDLGDHLVGDCALAFAGEADAEVVDDNRRARARQFQRHASAHAASGAGDDSDLAFHNAHDSRPQ